MPGLDHAELVALGVGQHDVPLLGELTDVEVAWRRARSAAATVRRWSAGLALVRWRCIRFASDLLRVRRDEPEADLRVVTRQQRATGSWTTSRPSRPAQNSASRAGSCASKVSVSSREGIPAR